MSLDEALLTAIGEVPDCVAGAYLDLNTGLALAVVAEEPEDEEAIETVAAALPDLFDGDAISGIPRAFGDGEEPADGSRISEFIVMGKSHVHVILRNPDEPDQVLSLVCKRDAKIGLVLAKSRKTVAAVAAAV